MRLSLYRSCLASSLLTKHGQWTIDYMRCLMFVGMGTWNGYPEVTTQLETVCTYHNINPNSHTYIVAMVCMCHLVAYLPRHTSMTTTNQVNI